MPSMKIVFGESAAKAHQYGDPDEKVCEDGEIKTVTFDTQAELTAYLQGLHDIDGWMGWCEYDPGNLAPQDEEFDDIRIVLPNGNLVSGPVLSSVIVLARAWVMAFEKELPAEDLPPLSTGFEILIPTRSKDESQYVFTLVSLEKPT